MTNIYYVYEWFFTDSGNIFYVGKGKGRRYREKKDRNDKFIKYINRYPCDVKKVYENLTEEEAFQKEIELIKYYKKLGQCSCNFTEGGESPPKHFGVDAPNRRQVVQLSLDGQYIKTWEYICEIEKELKLSNSAIVRCCKAKRGRRSVGGYLWVYLDEYDPQKKYNYNKNTNAKVIIQYSLDGTFLKEWTSAKEVNEYLGFRRSGICACCKGNAKTCEGYIWKYKTEKENPMKITGFDRLKGTSMPVLQLDLKGNLIAKFKDCADAGKSMGKGNTNILRSCNDKTATAYGFKWVYEHEYEGLKSGL